MDQLTRARAAHRSRQSSSSYKPHIDGLRAISVLLVMAFHLGLRGVPGGFIGVDVFLVISGFLITGILFDALQRGDFTFAWFYERRIRRILPALLVVFLATLSVAFLIVFPGDYSVLAKSTIFAGFGLSNFFFNNNSGYFDLSSKSMPLLHTWSLSVEEQFYLVWPLLMVVAFKLIGPRKPIWCALCGLIFVTSFGASIWMIHLDPLTAFYQPYTRAWELATGALLVFVPARRLPRAIAEALPALGLLAIAYAAVTLSERQPFPGLNALPPVLGAALLLYDGSPTIVARALSVAPLRFVGLISYSLYLWHWPIIVFWRIYTNYTPFTARSILGMTALAFLCAIVSWRFVERPFRHASASRKTVFVTAAAVDLCIVLLATVAIATDGFAFRVPASYNEYASKSVMWKWNCPQGVNVGIPAYPSHTLTASSCVAGADWATARHHAIVWGDSNAEQLMPLFDPVAKQADTAVLLVPICSPIIQAEGVRRFWPELPDYNRFCTDNRKAVLRLLHSDKILDRVILAANWSRNVGMLRRHDADIMSHAYGRRLLSEGLGELLPQLQATGRKVTLFADFPQWPPADAEPRQGAIGDPLACMHARGWLFRWCEGDGRLIPADFFNSFEKPTHDVLQASAADHVGVKVYKPEDYLCDATGCRASIDGVFIYRDQFHIRRNFTPETTRKLTTLLHLNQIFAH